MLLWNTYLREKLAHLAFFAVVGFLACPCIASPDGQKPQVSPASAAKAHSLTPRDPLGSLPIAFERNLGQANAGALFLARANGRLVQFEAGKMSITQPGNAFGARTDVRARGYRPSPSTETAAPETISFSFPGSRRRARPEARELLAGRTNYYLGPDPSKWHTGVPNYRDLRYAELYRGIDLIFHGENGRLEYDFAVAPGVDPTNIRMKISGAARITPASGSLAIQTQQGGLQLAKPLAYQERNGVRTEVASDFSVAGDVVRFRLGPYDHSAPLIIDPIVDFSTIFNAQPNTEISSVGLDSAGDIYVAANYSGYGQSFVTKIDANKTTVDFTTFLNQGESSLNGITAMVVDAAGNSYLTGNAASGYATTPGAFRATCPSTILDCSAPFVTKLDRSGNVVYSTYLSPGAGARAVAVDPNGNAYIGGNMSGPGLDIVNAFESGYQGMECSECENGFVQKLDAFGSSLLYSTYLAPALQPGGTTTTTVAGIAVDAAGSAYVTGNGATRFPTDHNSLLLNSTRGFFVVKFKPDGSDLVYADGIGGNSGGILAVDTSSAIALDAQGSAYITGLASTVDFPVTPGAFLPACEPLGSSSCGTAQKEIFALKLSPDGQALDYSTYIGTGVPFAVAVDSNGRAFIAGSTTQADFPTVNPIEPNIQVGPALFPTVGSAFVTAFDASGAPFFSTFFSGMETLESTRAVAVDSTGEHVVLGGFFSYGDIADFPLVGPLQSAFGEEPGFVASFDLSQTGPVLSVSPRTVPLLDLRNMGTAPLHISSIVKSDSSPVGGQCNPPLTLAPGASCILAVSVAANTTGSFNLIVNDDAGAQTFAISEPVTPVAIPIGSQIILTPSTPTLAFPTQLVGTLSQPKSVTVTNSGPGSGPIQSVTSTGEISQANDCPAVLNSGGVCSIEIVSAPVDLNAGGFITVNPGNPFFSFEVYASVTSTTSALITSASSINFGSQYSGMSYPSRTVVVRNAGPVAVGVGGVSVSGSFGQTNNCPASLAVGVECQIYVTFSPSGNGPTTGSLTIANDGVGGPVTVGLNGTGLTNSPLSISPLTLEFDGDITNLPNGPLTVTISNPSMSQSVGVASVVAAPSQFAISANNCSGALGPQGTCAVEVTFTGTTAGTIAGTLTVTPSGAGAPQVVPLSGTAGAAIQITPSPINFGDQQVNTTGVGLVANIGDQSLSVIAIQSISVSGDFQLLPSCGPSLPRQVNPHSGCSAGITFTPSAPGPRTGTISVMASDSATPHVAILTGNGVAIGMEISPASLNLGDAINGTSTLPQPVILSNISGAAIAVQSISASAPFSQTNNCGGTLASGGTCTIQVKFSPMASGPANGALTVQANAAGSPLTVALSGNGFSGVIATLSQTSVGFGSVNLGSSPATSLVSLGNPGTMPLTLSSIVLSGSDMAQYSETNNCPFPPASLAAGSSCTITIEFQPTSTGSKGNAAVSVTDNASSNPQTISLSGTGVDFSLSPLTAQTTVAAGSPAQFAINVSVSGGALPNLISFAASGLPSNANASFGPASIAAGSSTGSTLLVINTMRRGAALGVPGVPSYLAAGPRLRLALILICALVLLRLALSRRRTAWRVVVAAVIVSAMLLFGCSGGGGSGGASPGTPAGTYTIIVTATSGSASRTTQVSLTVQ